MEPKKSKPEMLFMLVEFFAEMGKVMTKSEYYRLTPDEQPINHRLLTRHFRGRGYNSIIKTARQMYPVEWASIGSKPVEVVKEQVVSQPVPKVKPVLEPASEKDLSPIEKLRTLSGESSE